MRRGGVEPPPRRKFATSLDKAKDQEDRVANGQQHASDREHIVPGARESNLQGGDRRTANDSAGLHREAPRSFGFECSLRPDSSGPVGFRPAELGTRTQPHLGVVVRLAVMPTREPALGCSRSFADRVILRRWDPGDRHRARRRAPRSTRIFGCAGPSTPPPSTRFGSEPRVRS